MILTLFCMSACGFGILVSYLYRCLLWSLTVAVDAYMLGGVVSGPRIISIRFSVFHAARVKLFQVA